MTRVGKIARLPQHLRTQLNERLADGELARTLVPWLNENWQVQEVLKEHFDSRPITEQNLSVWKNGGYVEWVRHQEARVVAQSFLAEADELEDEVGDEPLTDRTTEIAAIALLQLLREAQAEKGPDRRRAVLEIVRELQRLRRGDHQMRRLEIKEERWEAELDAADEEELKELREKTESEKLSIIVTALDWRQEYVHGMAKRTITPERAAWMRAYFEKNAAMLRTLGVPDLPPPVSRSKSKQIRPNPTKSNQIRPILTFPCASQ